VVEDASSGRPGLPPVGNAVSCGRPGLPPVGDAALVLLTPAAPPPITTNPISRPTAAAGSLPARLPRSRARSTEVLAPGILLQQPPNSGRRPPRGA